MTYKIITRKFYKYLRLIIAPTLRYSQYIYEDILNENCKPDCVWLDLGCGHHLLPPWRYEQEKLLVNKPRLFIGLDYDYHSLTRHKTLKNKIRGDVSYLPFASNTFNIVTSNMVFEHLEKPSNQLKEIYRILKPGGKLIFHTPNVLSYGTIIARITPEKIKRKIIYFLDERDDDDIFRTFYRINSTKKIRKIAKQAGLQIKKIKMICSSALFTNIPPVVFFELFLIRFLMTKRMKWARANIIAILEKPPHTASRIP